MGSHAVEFRLFSASGCAGEDDHVYMTQHRFLTDRPQNLNAVMPGKVEIQDDDAGMGFIAILPLNMDEFECLLPVGDDLNFNLFFKA